MENREKEHKRENDGKNTRQIQLLCINKKEKTYYRAFDGSKSTINLTIANLTIATEHEWSKEYELRGSNHFPIIIEVEREVSMKQQQRWSIEIAN